MGLRERTVEFIELILTHMVGSGVSFVGTDIPGNSRYDYFHWTTMEVLGAFDRKVDSIVSEREGIKMWGGRHFQWKKILDTWNEVKDDPGLAPQQSSVLDEAVFAVRCA